MLRSSVLYEFGDFALDVGRQRLSRRDTGETIPLTAKVFDTLVYLVERPEQTLDRDVLLREIWPGVIVEENSLSQNISTLRQVLGEARGENRYILTIPRKGYRFVAKVSQRDELALPTAPAETVAPLPARTPSRWRRIAWMAACAGVLMILIAAVTLSLVSPRAPQAVPVPGRTLAILPFKPLVPAERNESLELGMTETLIANLGQQGARAIAPLSSVRRYAALDQDAVIAGRELGVDAVLDGTLQRRGDRLRVSAQLVRVADGQQLWAQSFDQDFTTIFEVQDAIAAKVARALQMRGIVGSTRGIPGTHDPEAYALYASGRFAWTRQTEASLLQAVDFFQRAIARDPNYALAYSGLADSYALLGVFGMRAPIEVFPEARAAADKALAIDPDVAAAHAALGHILVQYDHDWGGGAREYARAKQLDPSLALTYHRRSILYALQGDTERSLAEALRARELEPLWLSPRVFSGHALYYARRYDESIAVLEQVLALDDSLNSARGVLIRSLIAKGEYARALQEYDKRPLQMPGSFALRAQALALSGRREAALAELDRVLKLSKERYVAAHDIAMIYAALGDQENAFSWLERAMDDRSTNVTFLATDPAFDLLHGDPRFASLVQRLGIYGRTLPDG